MCNEIANNNLASVFSVHPHSSLTLSSLLMAILWLFTAGSAVKDPDVAGRVSE